MASTTQNLYQCRLCLKRTPTRVNIFGGDFPKMLEILTSIKWRLVREGSGALPSQKVMLMKNVFENDGLPKYSCVQCASEVKSALITKTRILKAHKYLTDKLRKQGTSHKPNQKLTVQFQQHGKLVVFQQMVMPNKSNETAAIRCAKVSINGSSSEPQNSETPKDEVELEALEESQNSYDASVAEEDSDGFAKKVETKATRKQITYTCNTCNISFSKKRDYSLHCGKHSKTECDICKKMVRTSNMKVHLAVHSSVPSVCDLCGATYKNVMSLRGHMAYQHRNLNVYVCEKCGTRFNSRYLLLLHQKKAHTGVRDFKCETCGKAFFTKYYLIKHDRTTHKKLRPHICEFCNTGFSARHVLRAHKRQHTNEKPYVCDQCNEGFRQKVSLQAHLKSKHGIEEDKKSVCSECGKGFATDFALGIHQRLHKSMKCQVCSESFAGQEYLDNHMQEAHSVDSDVNEDES